MTHFSLTTLFNYDKILKDQIFISDTLNGGDQEENNHKGPLSADSNSSNATDGSGHSRPTSNKAWEQQREKNNLVSIIILHLPTYLLFITFQQPILNFESINFFINFLGLFFYVLNRKFQLKYKIEKQNKCLLN